MRETPISNCEREFVRQAIIEKKRIDARQPYDYRQIRIKFGSDRGSVQVDVGDTRVFAQVSCEISAPKQTRPADGVLFLNVELSPMASPAFEQGRLSDLGVEINRLLERCFKESRCVDMESLCIIAGEKVWKIRVDVHVMNHDGNIIDCASIAAITALAHFRRPDVTVNGSEVIVHPVEEKDPIPLSVHHMPICVSFSFYEQGKFLCVDPSFREEKVMDGKMVIGMNKHREICTLQITGQMLLLKDQVLRCSNIAVVKVTEITDLIHRALDNDKQSRIKGHKLGIAESIATETVTANHMQGEEVDLEEMKEKVATDAAEASEDEESEDDSVECVEILDKGVGAIGTGGCNTWAIEEDMEQELKEEVKEKAQDTSIRKKSALVLPPPKSVIDKTEYVISSESEEDVVVLDAEELYQPAKMKDKPQTHKNITETSENYSKNKKKKKKKLKPA